jgi:hypothetical protein
MGIDAYCPAAAAIGGETIHAVNPGLTGSLAEEMAALAALLENNICPPEGFCKVKYQYNH